MRLLDLLLPPACAGCGRSGALLCGRCVAALRSPSDPRDRFVAPDSGVVVGDRLALAIAAFAYEGPMRRALAALKYTGASRLAPILADLAAPALDRLLGVSGPAVAGPDPRPRRAPGRPRLQPGRADRPALGRPRRLPVASVLARQLPTTKQHRLNRAARLLNLRGAFVATERAPPVAILVDDIITTTATLEACASVLHDAGCQAVYGMAVAREV